MGLDAAKVAVGTGQAREVPFHVVRHGHVFRGPNPKRRPAIQYEAFKTRDIVPGILPYRVPARVEQDPDPLKGFRQPKPEKQMRMFNPFIVTVNDHHGHGEHRIGRRFRTRRDAQAFERKLAYDSRFYGSALNVHKVDPTWYERLGRKIKRAVRKNPHQWRIYQPGKAPSKVWFPTKAKAQAAAKRRGQGWMVLKQYARRRGNPYLVKGYRYPTAQPEDRVFKTAVAAKRYADQQAQVYTRPPTYKISDREYQQRKRNPRLVGRVGRGLVFRGTQAQAAAYARSHGFAAPVAVGIRKGARV